ncbi:nuclear transport factor 2 family protein [Crossiella sp. SN42]|uniref:nuclear transport factor 2 family protein n=1 Tax=Crossiella sp. SN42 TaxID=2944808 RepID=UPI00207C59DA|nr:nuclear transport factor 2 family protein [Crossiella sp. SN42]MCO1577261.1 nuclear transport factor 2 family protein [Crossiella sp. SN42]
MRIRPVVAGALVGALLLTACGKDGGTAPAGNGALEGITPANYSVADTVALEDIEAIQELKARYCRLLDTKQWQAWREVFADDFVSDTSAAGGQVVKGADAFIAFVRKQIGQPSQTTSHQVHMPEIELTSAATAKGIWALEDYVDFTPVLGLHGHGHYHETYVKTDGQWRIKTSKLTRIRQQLITPVASLPLPELKKKVQEALGR